MNMIDDTKLRYLDSWILESHGINLISKLAIIISF